MPEDERVSPVQTMISSRSGRICFTARSETISRTVRPFVAVLSRRLSVISRSAWDLSRKLRDAVNGN